MLASMAESVRNLLGSGEAAPSPLGIGVAATSLIVMPFLSWAQRRTGRELGSGSVVADSKQTLLCTYLSAVLLLGLVLNATLQVRDDLHTKCREGIEPPTR